MNPVAAERIAACRQRGESRLSLTHIGLEGFPAAVCELTWLEELEIHGQFTALPDEIHQLTRLRTLHLGSSVVDVTSLGGLPELRSLKLNGAKDVPRGLWSLTRLTDLAIIYALFPSPLTGISGLHDLERLQLHSGAHHHTLRALPDEICDLGALRRLSLDQSKLRQLPKSLGRLQKLEHLNVYQNRLERLPASFGELGALRGLSLRSNRLEKLPSFAELRSLTRVDLAQNRLEALPEGLIDLPDLDRLDVSYNPLRQLPPRFFSLKHHEYLSLSGHQLTALPAEIGRLQGVRHLNLSGNPLGSLPPELGELTELRTLKAARCGLTALPSELGRLTRLTTLDLTGNQLRVLPDALCRLVELRHLLLADNRLAALPEGLRSLPLETNTDDEEYDSAYDFVPGLVVSGNALPLSEAQLRGEPAEILGALVG